MLSTIDRTSRREVVDFLGRKPFENVYLRWLIESGFGAVEDLWVWRDWNGEIAGVVYFGPQIIIAAEDPAAVDAFAIEARRHPDFRMVVGPRVLVARFWSRVEAWARPPSAIRDRQLLFVVSAETLRERGEGAPVRLARLADAALVAEHAAEMMLGELGYDPRAHRPGFEAGVRGLIERGWWWAWIEAGDLRFMLNIGAETEDVTQLQGVWTPPQHRKRGYATRAMGAICARLLETSPYLSLNVNDFNHDAIALYERLGFAAAGELATYIFID